LEDFWRGGESRIGGLGGGGESRIGGLLAEEEKVLQFVYDRLKPICFLKWDFVSFLLFGKRDFEIETSKLKFLPVRLD
jgi:hypothetical protein